MLASARKRIVLANLNQEDEEEEPRSKGRKLYRFIQVFLLISVIALVVELVAHFNQWNLNLINPWEVENNIVEWVYMGWLTFRVDYLAPMVITLSKFCTVLFLIQSLDRLVLCVGCFWIKYKKLKPKIDIEEAYDVEDSSSYPMVLVQIPMCNEREVSYS